MRRVVKVNAILLYYCRQTVLFNIILLFFYYFRFIIMQERRSFIVRVRQKFNFYFNGLNFCQYNNIKVVCHIIIPSLIYHKTIITTVFTMAEYIVRVKFVIGPSQNSQRNNRGRRNRDRSNIIPAVVGIVILIIFQLRARLHNDDDATAASSFVRSSVHFLLFRQ